jgi:hypothetical protein
MPSMTRWLLPHLPLLFALLAPPAGAAPGAWVVGTAAPDGATTTILAIPAADTDATATAPLVTLATLAHRPGFLPRGSVDPTGRLLAVAVAEGSTRDASVVVLDLVTGQARTVGDEATPLSAPRWDGEQITYVRLRDEDAHGGTFALLETAATARFGEQSTLVEAHAGWWSPVAGATDAVLALDAKTGHWQVAAPKNGALAPLFALGAGGFRDATLLRAGPHPILVVEEVVVPHKKARLLRVEHGAAPATTTTTLLTGLPGLSPKIAGTQLLTGTGKKDGSLALLPISPVLPKDKAAPRRLQGPEVGVASPAAVFVDARGRLSALVRLSRGASLPGQLWLVVDDGKQGRWTQVPLPDGVVFEVYGVRP